LTEIEVALAISARDWPDRIHRFLADHGGARVRAQILSADDATTEAFQILIIDDICSFLTPRLVEKMRRQRRMVLGVFDPIEAPDGKERLLECGVDLVIEADAEADEFVIALRTLALTDEPIPIEVTPNAAVRSRPNLYVVGGPPGGCGATELAVALTHRLSITGPTILIDADEVSASIAQRLGLPLLPNLRSALDALSHRPDTLGKTVIAFDRFMVLTGLSGERDWMEIRPGQIGDLLGELCGHFRHVVVNCGSLLEQVGFADTGRFGITRQVVASADCLVGVGLPTPVGITRLLTWAAESAALNSTALMHLVVNRRPRSRYRLAEVMEEIDRAIPGIGVSFLPEDPAVENAAWTGSLASSGPYVRTVRKLADRIAGT
jgi:hypothetical protein